MTNAPSVDIIGSFFPVWMVCLIGAVILTFVTQYVLAKLRLDTEIGPVAVFYPSLLVLFTSLLWLTFFR
jgi:hypothetical protein